MADRFIEVVVNADTTHTHLAQAIADIAILATRIHESVGGKTVLDALLSVYMNLALDQVGLAEAQGALQRALEQLPELDRARQLPPTQGTA
jgi:hypothetical protein